jgi:hypothetical protein
MATSAAVCYPAREAMFDPHSEGASNDVVNAASGDFGNPAVGPPKCGTGGRQERRTTLWGPVSPKANRGKTLRWATAARPVDPDGRPQLPNQEQPVSARPGEAGGSGLLLSRRRQGGPPRQSRVGAGLLPRHDGPPASGCPCRGEANNSGSQGAAQQKCNEGDGRDTRKPKANKP